MTSSSKQGRGDQASSSTTRLRSPVAHGKQTLARGEARCSQGADRRKARARRPRRLASGTPAPGRRSHSSQHHDPRAPSPIDSTPSRATTGRTGASSARPARTWAVSRQGAGSSVGKTAASTMTTEEPPPRPGTSSKRRAQPAGRQCPPRPRAKTPVARPTITVQLPLDDFGRRYTTVHRVRSSARAVDTSETSPQRHNLARFNLWSSARAVTARVPATGDSVPRRPPATCWAGGDGAFEHHDAVTVQPRQSFGQDPFAQRSREPGVRGPRQTA